MTRARYGLAAIALSTSLLVSGCLGIGKDDPSAGASAPGAVDAAPIDVTDSDVTMVDGRVVTACFSYDAPSLTTYALNPNSGTCQSSIRWASASDNLTDITVSAQTGPRDLAELADSLSATGALQGEPTETVVAGQPSIVAQMTDGYGLPLTVVIVTLPEARFEAAGEEVTSIFIAMHAGGDEFQNALAELLDSLEIA